MAYGYPHMSFIGYPVPLPCAGHGGLGLRRAHDPDAPAVLAHYLRLSPADLRRRFCATLGAPALERHVARLGSRGGLVLVAIDGPLFAAPFLETGPVRAVAELVGTGREMELGISVDSDLRCRGIGTELVQTAARLLAPQGVTTIRAYSMPDNRAFYALARRLGAEVEVAHDQVEVVFDVAALTGSYLWRRASQALRLAL